MIGTVSAWGLAGVLFVAGCSSSSPVARIDPAVVDGTVFACDATSCRIVAEERGGADADATAAEPATGSAPDRRPPCPGAESVIPGF
jgi:hypothetical protein